MVLCFHQFQFHLHDLTYNYVIRGMCICDTTLSNLNVLCHTIHILVAPYQTFHTFFLVDIAPTNKDVLYVLYLLFVLFCLQYMEDHILLSSNLKIHQRHQLTEGTFLTFLLLYHKALYHHTFHKYELLRFCPFYLAY